MSGQTNLNDVLKSLDISCDGIEYGFANIKADGFPQSADIIGTFSEKEGLTIIASVIYLRENNIQFDGPYAKLTIEVHTSLQLVGLTAVLSKQLAENGISANVVAAYYHDHIFVQYEHRQKAIELLYKLKDSEK